MRKEEKDRARKIELLKERVARTENDVANPPEIEDIDVIKQEMVRICLFVVLGIQFNPS